MPGGREAASTIAQEEMIDQQADELRQMAERFAAAMSGQFDEQFDFTPQSLARLDGALEQWRDLAEPYRGQDQRELLEMAIPLAAYVGEVIRRATDDAIWVTEHEEGQIAPPHLRIGDTLRVNVVKQAMQVISGAQDATFVTYFRTVTEFKTANDVDEDH